MILKDINQYMLELWTIVHMESKNTKDSSIPEEVLSRFYEGLDEEYREAADLIFSDWVLALNTAMRFDALGMINKYNITISMNNLIELSKRLSKSKIPSDVYELKKVKRIIEKLENL